MDWAQILIVTLTVFFAVFVIVALVLAVYLIKLTRQIKVAVASAENAMSSIEKSTKTFKRATLPFVLAKGVVGRVRSLRKKKDKQRPE